MKKVIVTAIVSLYASLAVCGDRPGYRPQQQPVLQALALQAAVDAGHPVRFENPRQIRKQYSKNQYQPTQPVVRIVPKNPKREKVKVLNNGNVRFKR